MNNENLAAEIGQMIHNPTDKLHPDTVHETLTVGNRKGRATPVKEEPKVVKEEQAVDTRWEPVDPWPTQLDRVKYCAKHTLLFGALCLLVFYWQQTGQMLSSAAVPTMMACCGGAMWHVGRAWK